MSSEVVRHVDLNRFSVGIRHESGLLRQSAGARAGPCFSYGRVEALIKLIEPLRREARCECMLIAGTWFKTWARQNGKADLLTGLRTVWLDELLLY